MVIMPKIVDHSERRKVFAQAAKEAIASKGIEPVRLVDVARAAGVTTGSLSHYFSDRDDLIDAALEELVIELEAKNRVEAMEGSLLDACMTIMPVNEEGVAAARVWLAFINRGLVNADVAKKMAVFFKINSARLSTYLIEYEGKAPRDAENLAETIGTFVDGLMVRATLDPEGWPAARQRAQVEAVLLELVGPGALIPQA